MKTTSNIQYTYSGYLHCQVFNEKSWSGPKNNQPLLSQDAGLVLHAFPENNTTLYKKLVYLGVLWAHPEYEICQGAAELALTHPSFTSEHLFSLCPLH